MQIKKDKISQKPVSTKDFLTAALLEKNLILCPLQ